MYSYTKQAYSSINIATINGKKYWSLEWLDMLYKSYGRVFVEFDTLKPRFRYYETKTGVFQIDYNDETIEVKANQQGVLWGEKIQKNGFVSDLLLNPFLISLMPLKVGFQKIFPSFSLRNFEVEKLRYNVVGIETVTVPAGSFDCFKVVVEIQSEGKWLKSSSIWFSKDKKFEIVKANLPWGFIELEETALDPKSISSFQEGALKALYK